MKFSIGILLCIILNGCSTHSPSMFKANSNKYQSKYLEFIGKEEKIISSWYHYVKTETAKNTYILRTFFPETKQITSEINFIDKSTRVAKGLAKYWHENGNLKSEGNYSNSNRVGNWKFFHRNSGKILSQGNFKKDLKNGTWEYYDSKGRIEKIVNYENGSREGKFVQYDSLQVVVNKGIYKSDTIIIQSKMDTSINSQKPYLSECKGIESIDLRISCSQEALLTFIYKNLRYPKKARDLGIQGTTLNQFIIQKDGSVKNIEVVEGICQEFIEMNMEVLSNMPKWEAGSENGEKVDVLYTLPIRYKLESSTYKIY